MATKYQSVNGMHDTLPADMPKWRFVEQAAISLFENFGFSEIRTPIVEHTELFVRSVGEKNQVVEKEMYSFEDQGEKRLSLRPEATACVVRAYIEASLYNDQPLAKLYTIGPMFRRERPQKGRYRQFHQISVEVIGSDNPAMDAELMAMCDSYFKKIGITHLRLEINSVGRGKSRENYLLLLTAFLGKQSASLCTECQSRMIKNPMRVLDCKNPDCQKVYEAAPFMADHLSLEDAAHYARVKEHLDLLGIDYVENKKIVRGLDYYVNTAFEFVSDQLGTQGAVAAGGRYDGLVKSLGGPDLPGIGFAIGLDRVVLLANDSVLTRSSPPVFFALLGDESRRKFIPLIHKLRLMGAFLEWDNDNRSLKSQMRRADKLNARWVIIAGEEELKKGVVVLREMRSKEQRELKEGELESFVRGAI